MRRMNTRAKSLAREARAEPIGQTFLPTLQCGVLL
jgi:hypothetical protein